VRVRRCPGREQDADHPAPPESGHEKAKGTGPDESISIGADAFKRQRGRYAQALCRHLTAVVCSVAASLIAHEA
jgi:hypothetical protein